MYIIFLNLIANLQNFIQYFKDMYILMANANDT